jgi:DNA-binding response OmpR family regulator
MSKPGGYDLSSSTHSILVVDDELDIVVIFKQALSREGYTVFGFTDPLLALEFLRKPVDVKTLVRRVKVAMAN